MAACGSAFKRAMKLHRARRFQEAEAQYLAVLDRNPGHCEGLHQLGLLHAETGRHDTAIQLLRAAIGIEGPSYALCRNLGIILQKGGNDKAALACFRQALEERPCDTSMWRVVAELHSASMQYDEAAAAWQRVVEAEPRQPDFRLYWANALALAGRRVEAIEQYDRILSAQPGNVEACFHRAVALMQADRSSEAAEGFARTLDLNPRHAGAANNAGILLQVRSEYSAAIASYRRAICADRNFAAAVYNLGTAWQEFGRPREAVCVLRKVLRLEPDHGEAWTNLGNAWLSLNQASHAETCYRTAVTLSSQPATPAWNLGIALLLQGRWEEGWRAYDRRFDVPGATPRRRFAAPLWDGSDPAGRTILLHAEQGLGDTIQFVRYATELEARGARVVVECQRELLGILCSLKCSAAWIAAPDGDRINADFQLPMLSAPAVCGTTGGNIPLADGYLAAPAEAVRRWKKWLGPRGDGRRVGITWAGNPNHKNDRNRSIDSDLLRELTGAGGTEWISLQKGHAPPASLEAWDAARVLTNFADTAGLIENLDLVISVDTSVAHLAGALGKPVWILLPYAPDWRWQLTGSLTPWYSAARLFRQKTRGDWAGLLREVVEELSRFRSS